MNTTIPEDAKSLSQPNGNVPPVGVVMSARHTLAVQLTACFDIHVCRQRTLSDCPPVCLASIRVATHIVGAAVSLLPLNQKDLGHHQCGDEDEHHLGMHGLMAPVLHVQPLMLYSAGTQEIERERRERGEREEKNGKTEICSSHSIQNVAIQELYG